MTTALIAILGDPRWPRTRRTWWNIVKNRPTSVPILVGEARAGPRVGVASDFRIVGDEVRCDVQWETELSPVGLCFCVDLDAERLLYLYIGRPTGAVTERLAQWETL